MKYFVIVSVSVLVSAAAMSAARACDLCGCYTPQMETLIQAPSNVPFGQSAGTPPPAHSWSDNFYGAISEQFTHFGTVQVDGDEVSNPTGQREESSITQLVGGYSFTHWLALQVNVPLIYRYYKRPEGFAIERGTESGLGDVSLLTRLVLFHAKAGGGRAVNFDDPKSPKMEMREPDFTASGLLLLGAKFPTGDSSRLKEEFDEIEIPGAPESGIHGHDLALGTGSYDGIFGGQTSIRYKNTFFEAEVQFTLRGDGLHQYHFANDLSWSGGPGYYFIRNKSTILGLQFVVSGEHKDVDRFRGKEAEDTGITSVFVGPRVVASLGRFSGEVESICPLRLKTPRCKWFPIIGCAPVFRFGFDSSRR